MNGLYILWDETGHIMTYGDRHICEFRTRFVVCREEVDG